MTSEPQRSVLPVCMTTITRPPWLVTWVAWWTMPCASSVTLMPGWPKLSTAAKETPSACIRV